MVPAKGKQAPRKGNGKPKEQAKSSLTKQVTVTKKEVEPTEIKENTLTFPLLKTVDNSRLMPRYTSIINRTEEEGVRVEDLDILKIELKGLIANVSVRVRALEGELKNLGSVTEDKKDRKRQLLDKAPASPAKRGKFDDKPVKKVKETPVRGREPVTSPPSIKITRVKSITVHDPVPPSAALPPEPEPPRVITPRNDNPSKFWQSMDLFCSDITTADIKFLEESIRCREKGPDFPPIPTLGEHFTVRWGKEDIRNEQESSSTSADKKPTPGTSSIVGKKIQSIKLAGIFGPFTQRLVSALIEDPSVTSKEKADIQACKDGENITPLKTSKSINPGNANLEKVVVKELEEQGFLDKDNPTKVNSPGDEIMKEIAKVQNELTAVTAYNSRMLKHILLMARDQIPRQELRKKVKIADNEIRELYKKFAAAKLKKRIPTKREKEQGWRILRERDYLLRQLYGFPPRRRFMRPVATQVRPTPEKVTVLKPPMGKGPMEKSRLAMLEKQAAERANAEKQALDKYHQEKQALEKQVMERPTLDKLIGGKLRPDVPSFSKQSCIPLVRPPLDNPPMDSMMP